MGKINATFGRFNRFNNNASAEPEVKTERKQAEFWINVGYETGDEKYPFVSLPLGVPLSLDDRKEIRGTSEYVNFLSAQNGLLEELIELAGQLEPGEDTIFSHPEMPLALQLRRVRGEVAPTETTENPLARRVFQATAEQPGQPSAEAE